jgi:hypothetical protein
VIDKLNIQAAEFVMSEPDSKDDDIVDPNQISLKINSSPRFDAKP